MPFEDFSKRPEKISASDPYRVLEIERRADDATIKRAYFQLVRQYPPESAPEKFQEVRAAYEQLRNPESRARVDLFLLQAPPILPNRRRASYDLSVHREDFITLALELAATSMEEDFVS